MKTLTLNPNSEGLPAADRGSCSKGARNPEAKAEHRWRRPRAQARGRERGASGLGAQAGGRRRLGGALAPAASRYRTNAPGGARFRCETSSSPRSWLRCGLLAHDDVESVPIVGVMMRLIRMRLRLCLYGGVCELVNGGSVWFLAIVWSCFDCVLLFLGLYVGSKVLFFFFYYVSKIGKVEGWEISFVALKI